MAYNRASVHLLTFKRALVEGARVLSEALQWVSLVDYAVMAWGYVKVRISVSDPDPCGSVMKWLPWIRIRTGIGNTDPDPGQSKRCP